MDIARLSTIKSQVEVKQQVSMALTKNVMDIAEQNADNLVKMMEQIVVKGVGNNVDVKL